MKQCIVNVMMLILICCCDHSRHKHNSVSSCQYVISQVIRNYFLIISIHKVIFIWKVAQGHDIKFVNDIMAAQWHFDACTWGLGSLYYKSDILTLPNWVLKQISHVLRSSIHVEVGWTETLINQAMSHVRYLSHWSGHFGHWER